MKIKIKKLNKDAKIPTYATKDDAGMDLYAVEAIELKRNSRALIKTGIAMEIPEGYVGLIWDKSGLAHNFGLKVMGGVDDSGYRGEIGVILFNTMTDMDYHVEKGQKVAQMIIQKKETAEFEEVETLSESERGDGSLGSTGK